MKLLDFEVLKQFRLPFRKLVSKYGCDIAYTPMIFACGYIASEECRLSEFTTDAFDNPVVQFAANKPEEFATVAEMVYGQCRGIDLNCGCPKANVRKGGHGSKLLESPDLIADIIKQTRARISDPEFIVSAKIRIRYPIEQTVDLCRKVILRIHNTFCILEFFSLKVPE